MLRSNKNFSLTFIVMASEILSLKYLFHGGRSRRRASFSISLSLSLSYMLLFLFAQLDNVECNKGNYFVYLPSAACPPPSLVYFSYPLYSSPGFLWPFPPSITSTCILSYATDTSKLIFRYSTEMSSPIHFPFFSAITTQFFATLRPKISQDEAILRELHPVKVLSLHDFGVPTMDQTSTYLPHRRQKLLSCFRTRVSMSSGCYVEGNIFVCQHQIASYRSESHYVTDMN